MSPDSIAEGVEAQQKFAIEQMQRLETQLRPLPHKVIVKQAGAVWETLETLETMRTDWVAEALSGFDRGKSVP